MENEKRYALLIDADNISPKYIDMVMKETVMLGVTTFRRIYADWTDVSKESWKKVLLDYSLTPIQQYSYTYGKNSSDSAMIIDAMDILYTGDVDGFILVTSDSDFTRLASRLRESGKQVIGMGESKTPAPFVKACEQFKVLDLISKGRKKHSVAEVTNESAQQPLEKASGEENKTSTKKSSRSKRRERNRQKNAQMAENSVEIAGKILDKAEEPELEKTEAFSEKSESAMAAETVNPVTSLEEIQAQIMAILEERSDDDGWMFLGDIGNMLIKSFPDFDARNYGYKKVRELIEDIPDFEVRSELSSNKRTKLVYVKSRDRNTNL